MIIQYMLIAGLGGFAGTCGRYLTGVAGKNSSVTNILPVHLQST